MRRAITPSEGHRSTDYDVPKTPEPFTEESARLPSPPRPRLRLKRRNVSQHLSAPTQQFLASVAAADIPIPSIEEPEIAPFDADMAQAFPGMEQFTEIEDAASLHVRGRTFSPPKTPAPGSAPSLSPSRYPNWSIDSALSSWESSPEPESSRPSTSRSNRTSTSSFSRLSSCFSDDIHLSPEFESTDKFNCISGVLAPSATSAAKTARRKAPWTKAMDTHLWSTYTLYLEDPNVTPMRTSRSGVPPEGVIERVAREAKRSWKGSKTMTKASIPMGRKSGSTTPTLDASGAFMEWPHSGGATRAHLREMCKLKAAGPMGGKFRYMSRSPTPFAQTTIRQFNRRVTPSYPSTTFQTQDMAMSLTMSTSDTMNLQAPLAQLTSSALETPARTALTDINHLPLPDTDEPPSIEERRRFGSPFSAKSYGPSSSASLMSVLGSPNSRVERQNHTIGPRRTLRSPVRLSRSGTQKRRTRQSQEPRKRPSLSADFFLDPAFAASLNSMHRAQETEYSSTSSTRQDDLFIPRTATEPSLITSRSLPQVTAQQLAPPLLPPPRLGSPFSGHVASHSVPNRFTQPGNFVTMLGRPFATVQQPSEPTADPARVNLASRLAYIDRRLKEFNGRGQRRSESPL